MCGISVLVCLDIFPGDFRKFQPVRLRERNDVNVSGGGSPFLFRFAAPHEIRFHFLALNVD